MVVKSNLSEDKKVLIISVEGKFDFTVMNDFRKAYTNDSMSPAKIIVDLRSTPTVDSSALGMLLNMQRTLKKADGDISIINCNDDVKSVFQITHFEKKFVIE